jgi:hypothetical protein
MYSFNAPTCLLVAFVVISCSRSNPSGEQEAFLTGTEAAKAMDFPLVTSATNFLFYENVGGLQFLDRFGRLQVPPNLISNQLGLIITDNKGASINNIYNLT